MRIGWPAYLLVAPLACTGLIGGGDEDTGQAGDFLCDEDALPAALPLRRLSRTQYENTISDLVRLALPSDADTILTTLEPRFAMLPEDVRVGPDKHYAGLSRLDQAVQQDHVDVTYAIAADVGAAFTATAERLIAFAGACATDADTDNDASCLDELIRRFGERALRRPIDDADIAFYRTPAGAPPYDAADYADVVALLLNAPHLFYFVEHGADDAEVSAPLSAFELASRLSYHFWQTMPDEQLFEAARSGALLSDDGYRAAVDRIYADPRTEEAIALFFGEWLENTTLEELDSRVGTPVYDAFAGELLPGPDLREHMLGEVVDAALFYARRTEGTFQEFFSSNKSFARTDDLAAIYGVPVWDGVGEPPELDASRAGLLTRAAYLATGSANTRPIMKGVFLRKAILCDDIPPPPANAAANPPMLSQEMSTRQVVEELTQQGVCGGCHATVINPLGFATENFDALGRLRDEQPLYDETTGAEVGTAPIDTQSVPQVDDGNTEISSGASDLLRMVLASKKPAACFARHYFRFTFGRLEDDERDGCALYDVKRAVEEGRPLAEVLRAVALTPSFRERTFE